MMNTLSLLIPIYNEAAHLERFLHHIDHSFLCSIFPNIAAYPF